MLQVNNQLGLNNSASSNSSSLINNNILQGILTLLIKVCQQSEENVAFFIENKGFQCLF